MSSSRDSYIDFLRALGLLLIVAIHVGMPQPYATIRVFDVPLMVFVSALCANYSNGGVAYFKKRLIRIYRPVSLFLIFFFLLALIPSIQTGHYKFSISQVVGAFCLLNYPSIDYLWIMRIFLMIALATPFVAKLVSKLNWASCMLVMVALIELQQLAIDYLMPMITVKSVYAIVDQYPLYLLGYLPVLVLGLKMKTLSRKQMAMSTVAFGLVN